MFFITFNISFYLFILSSFLFYKDIDYDCFRRFLDAFLDCETPTELAQHLFVSFLKTNVNNVQQLQGKTLNQMAAISSTAACAPVTAHTKGNNKKYNIQYLLCYISRKKTHL